ncbi:hypothetical protein [Nocardioides sp.]|uniref:hypothetical protein n=1 Tax=Nocardioides sp. TaxID=35761 RepID=UPI0031FF27AB
MLTLALSPVFAATACSGDDGPADPGSPATSGGAHGVEEVATKATIGKVTGRLAPARRKTLRANVKTLVDHYLDAAYVSGDYPRSEFADAFPGFTKGAESDARKDRSLMSNAAIGQHIDGVEARHRRLRIDVLAVRKKAVGVTARFVLDFDTSGERKLSERVKGLLYMTWQHHGGWKVFGYDVSRGVRR